VILLSPKRKKKLKAGAGKLRLAFMLALVGGILMLIAGMVGSIGIIGFAFQELQTYFPQYANLIAVVLAVLTVIASLGGIAVIIGGFLLLRARLTTGKLLIGLGAGVGIIGAIIGLASGLAQGWGLYASFVAVFATGQILGWVAIFLSILARILARK
jgi:hypothetical protein